MPDVSLDRSRPDAVRLLPLDADESPAEGSADPMSAPPVVLLARHHLEAVGAEPVERVEAAGFYLGARTSPEEGRRRIWRYKGEWVFLDFEQARRRMESENGPGHPVRVFHLPALAVHTADHILLVTDIGTAEPLLQASERLPAATPFRPPTLKAAVSFMFEGRKAKQLEGMFFALVHLPALDRGSADGEGLAPAMTGPRVGILPGATSAYAVHTLASPEARAGLKAGKRLGELPSWTQDALRVSDEFVGELVGGRHRKRRGSLHG